MKRLGVNIDHVATIRNARGSNHPDPLVIAKHIIECGAHSVTIHLREDRRHINDRAKPITIAVCIIPAELAVKFQLVNKKGNEPTYIKKTEEVNNLPTKIRLVHFQLKFSYMRKF